MKGGLWYTQDIGKAINFY